MINKKTINKKKNDHSKMIHKKSVRPILKGKTRRPSFFSEIAGPDLEILQGLQAVIIDKRRISVVPGNGEDDLFRSAVSAFADDGRTDDAEHIQFREQIRDAS